VRDWIVLITLPLIVLVYWLYVMAGFVWVGLRLAVDYARGE
jgi:hypothetical protein